MKFLFNLFRSKKKKLEKQQQDFENKMKRFHQPLTAYKGGKASEGSVKSKTI